MGVHEVSMNVQTTVAWAGTAQSVKVTPPEIKRAKHLIIVAVRILDPSDNENGFILNLNLSHSPLQKVNMGMRAGPMVSDLDIWWAANLLIRKPGANAELEAAKRADLMLDRGDVHGRLLWMRIRRAIEELQAPRRDRLN